jgi:hypothetical protein
MLASTVKDDVLSVFQDSSLSSPSTNFPSDHLGPQHSATGPGSQSATDQAPHDDLLGGFEGSLGKLLHLLILQATPGLCCVDNLSACRVVYTIVVQLVQV